MNEKYDVIEQKRREVEHDRFLELSYDLLCIVDYDLVIKRVNQAFTRVLGYSKSELIGTVSNDYIHPDDEGPLLREFDKLIRNNLPMINYVNRIQTKGGLYKLIEWTNIPVPEEQVIYSIGRDISEAKRTQQEMVRLERLNLIGQMAAGIGHEIRNPMTTVRGYLQLLGTKQEFHTYQDTLETMISEIDRANSIITEFLSLAKNKPTEVRSQNINHIVRKLYPLLEADTYNQNKQIIFDEGETPNIPLDAKEISQMVLNMCRNGLEAMQERGILCIRTYTESEHVVLSIQDEGLGIPYDYLEKVGTPFFTTKDNGTGLGVAICYSIANRHNASIDVESGPSGTTFYVRFPLR